MPATPPPHLAFRTPSDLGDWLSRHHLSEKELWVRIFRSAAGTPSVTWTDCVVEAICFGWIDGRKHPLDAVSFLQRLTPRKPKSNWSARNRAHATALIAEGRMTPAGLKHVEDARADGRWDTAYAGPATMTIPPDFLAALATRPQAQVFFDTLDRKNLYTIYYRLHTAKTPATRARRLEAMLAQMERGERFH